MMCKPCYMKGFLVKGNYSDGTCHVSSTGSPIVSAHCRTPSSNIGIGFGLKAPQEAWQPGGAQETPGSLEEIQREMAELDR